MEELKEERSRTRRKVTVLATRLLKSVEKELPDTFLKKTFLELQEAYIDFITCNAEYNELLETDETLKDDYELVNGLNPDQYAQVVEDTYNRAKIVHDFHFEEKKRTRRKSKSESSQSSEEFEPAASDINSTPVVSTPVTPTASLSTNMILTSTTSGASPSIQPVNVLQHALTNFGATNSYSPYSAYMSTSTSASSIPSFGAIHSLPHSVPLVSINPTTQYFGSAAAVSSFGAIHPLSSSTLHLPVSTAPINSQLPHSPGPVVPGANPSIPLVPPPPVNVKVKAAELPHFSGLRKDWPEFRSVWPKLAIPAFPCKELLACELRRCIKGTLAEKKTSHISIVGPQSFDDIWNCLSLYYDDDAEAVNSILKDLNSLKPVKEGDYRNLVEHINKIEGFYTQLCSLNQQCSLSMREIDNLALLLPETSKKEWHRIYKNLSFEYKRHPFPPYLTFLREERASVSRLAEQQPTHNNNSIKKKEGFSHNVSLNSKETHSSKKRPKCALHGSVNHNTENCYSFQRLSNDDKIKVLREASACYRCLGYHPRGKCPEVGVCTKCGIGGHKPVLCLTRNQPNRNQARERNGHPQNGVNHQQRESNYANQERNSRPQNEIDAQHSESHHAIHKRCRGLYAIFSVPVLGSNKHCSVFTDDGSDSSYITNKAAKRLGARKLNKYTLEVTTTGGNEIEYDSYEYELDLVTKTGKVLTIRCFSLDKITGDLSQIDSSIIRKLFPHHDSSILTRRGKEVDVLLGTDYFGAHPKKELCTAGDHLSIMEGTLGVCIQGSHPSLQIENALDSNMVKVLKSAQIKTESHHSLNSIVKHPLLNQKHLKQKTQSHVSNVEFHKIQNFIQGEEVGTQIIPNCGSCKCSKCPLPGHTYSFQEESELKLIQDNLQYDEENNCWITKYPWKCDPNSLPDNKSAALSTLFKLEKRLNKDENLKVIYQEQMQDMLNRNVAREIDKNELKDYKGPYYYISHLGVPNPRSKSTPYRIVFNSSQLYKGISLNNFLFKGPDAYLNNQLGILMRWREEKEAIVSDIKKMYNSVHLDIEAQHCHRFLWRLDYSTEPKTYCITRVNMGDKPAGAISSEALYKTADMFSHCHPRAAILLKSGSYVDDLMDSVPTKDEALDLSKTTEEILAKGGFRVKFWLFTGSHIEDEGGIVQVLGVCWKPQEDLIGTQASLNFSHKKQGVHMLPDLKAAEISANIPERLTKRIVLAQMMRIYDPLGLLSPFTLRGKILLRNSWQLKLGWDETLPAAIHSQWVQFFTEVGEISSTWYPRVLKPENCEGLPGLIIFSDASDEAFGFVAYARWYCTDGIYRSRLIFSKSRIAPLTKRTTPQLELNAAVLSKRAKEVVSKEMRYNFDPQQIIHITDSETVLAMLQKTSTRFKLYEGVRVGEIQAASNGDVSNWAWIRGEDNIADWVTRGKNIKSLGPTSEWFLGPTYMRKPISEWGLKFGDFKSQQSLPGEKMKIISNSATVEVNNSSVIKYERFSNYRKLIRVIARVVNLFHTKSVHSVTQDPTASMIDKAEDVLIKDMQKDIQAECVKKDRQGRVGGKFYRLKPLLLKDKWVVGTRLQINPLVPDNRPQYLLPTNHYVTKLLMIQAHKDTTHRSRDSTLARFRQRFWIVQGSKIANSVVNNCQLCKLRKPVLLSQKMGNLPLERSCPSPPFTYCMVDYFGPFSVCGEVQKRITGKAWGVVFTDMVSRAVFIEAVYEFNTDAFLIALSKFASIRGFPHVMYSDPGSNFCSASRELDKHWKSMLQDDKDKIISYASEKGMEWKFSTADSPWQNGAVEALVKSIKKVLNIVMQNQRLSPSEFSGVLYGVANDINERPIATMTIDAELSILTPNSLLLGRSTAKNPGEWHPTTSVFKRFNLVKQIEESFWKQWVKSTAPNLITDAKWHSESQELKPGDVVLVQDSDNIKAGYKLAVVQETFKSSDGIVRKARILYKTYRVGDKTVPYHSTDGQSVFRPVQKLALVVPVTTEDD